MPRIIPITTGVDKRTGKAKQNFCARILQAAFANLKHIKFEKMLTIETINGTYDMQSFPKFLLSVMDALLIYLSSAWPW